MIKIIGSSIMGLLMVCSVYAQEDKLEEARKSFFANDLAKAKTYIDDASQDEKMAKNYHVWYWKGTIYKEIYKETEKGKQYQSDNRTVAIEAYMQALAQKINQDTVNMINKSLKFLASTLYNNAVLQLDTVNYATAVKNYAEYKKLNSYLSPNANTLSQDVKFKMKLATLYVSLYEANSGKPKGDEYFEIAKKEYGEIIELNKQHLSANYNLGILYYNRAVHIIQSMEYDIDLELLSEKEELCVELFLKALPYVKTAYDIDPKRRETLISLKGIYYSLNDMEKYDAYKKELDALSN